MSTKSTTALDQKLYADLQLTDEVLGNDYAADGETVVGTCRIPLEDLLRRGIVPLDAPIATVNTANTVSVAGPILGFTNDSQLVVRFSTTAGTNGWVSITGGLFTGDNISELINDSGFQDAADVSASITTAINNLLAGAPGALDTLNELSAALGDDPDFAGTITAALSGKEPTQTPASQIEAEAGTEVALRSWSPLRVKQAVDSIGAAFVTTAQSAATAASNSETAAAASEAAAASSASAASTSETNAGNSASAAATSETNAGNSASAAATSETNAGNSASAAATSETNAGSSASAASTSESNAAASETAAEAAQSYAEEWANKAEDSLVSAAAGGDEVDDYSALHHAAKASDSATAAAGSAAVAASISGPVANPKAFAGGVAITEAAGRIVLPSESVGATSGAFSVVIKGKMTNTGEDNIFMMSNSPVADVSLSQRGLQIGSWYRNTDRLKIQANDANGSASRISGGPEDFYDGSEKLLIVRYNPVSGNMDYSVDGVAFINVGTYANLAWNEGLIQYVILGNDPVNDVRARIGGTFTDYAFFNRDLTDTEASAIYNQGLSAWLAANPWVQWGSPTEGDIADDVMNGTIDGWTATNYVTSSAGTGSWLLGTQAASAQWISSRFTKVIGLNDFETLRVKFDYKSSSANLNALGVACESSTSIRSTVETFAPTTDGTWRTVEIEVGLDFVDSLASNDVNLVGIIASSSDGSEAQFELRNIKLTSTGALVALPMDEGIGYQLRDLSTNKYDALLSASGFEHLKPKREGFIRDFNVDAYNGGAGDVELISSSRDVLPIGAIITSAQARNNAAGTVGAGLLDLKRSDRTTRNTIGDNAVDIETTRFGLLSTDEASQIHNDLNVALHASGDSDATDLDVRVDYELID